jgi:hypothetical protein
MHDARDDDAPTADRLLRLAARESLERADSPYYADERFIEWLAADLRATAAGGGAAPERVHRVAERMRVAALAARCGVLTLAGRPAEVPAAETLVGTYALDACASLGCAARVELAAAAGDGRELWDEPVESLVRLPAGVAPGRHVAITVAGDSMTPLLHEGDVVLVRLGAPGRAAPGQGAVVLARRPGDGYVLKCVGRAARGRVELLSLNPAYPPVAAPRAGVAGVVVARWCAHGEAPDGTPP